MSTCDLALVVPVFNEEGTIQKVIRAWDHELQKLNTKYKIHVYDDGSSDETSAIVGSLHSQMPSVIAHTKPNAGHGPTILEGYVAHCDRSEWLFQVDSDDEMGPEWFYKLWNIRHDHDFVVGNRHERASSFLRKIVSLSARLAVRWCYGPSIYDVNCPYRLMRCSAFAPCFRSIPPNTFAVNVLISGFAAINNLKTVEIHIPHRSRYSGRVSIAKWTLVRGAFVSFCQTVRYRRNVPRIRADA